MVAEDSAELLGVVDATITSGGWVDSHGAIYVMRAMGGDFRINLLLPGCPRASFWEITNSLDLCYSEVSRLS
jgi:hypothetical protein